MATAKQRRRVVWILLAMSIAILVRAHWLHTNARRLHDEAEQTLREVERLLDAKECHSLLKRQRQGRPILLNHEQPAAVLPDLPSVPNT